jgi:hypothetical protein
MRSLLQSFADYKDSKFDGMGLLAVVNEVGGLSGVTGEVAGLR